MTPLIRSFSEVSETPGSWVTAEGARMVYTRYAVGAGLACGHRVLDLGCAAGMGLEMLVNTARFTVGADIDLTLLNRARQEYGTAPPLIRLDARQLPFRDGSFDVVLFFEASYYVPDLAMAAAEIARVLAARGTVLFVTANPDRPGFIPSPFARHYHSAEEFEQLLKPLGFRVSLEGAFPLRVSDPRETISIVARRLMANLHLIPESLKARAILKRIVHPSQVRLPARLPDGFADIEPLWPLVDSVPSMFKVIYVAGTLDR